MSTDQSSHVQLSRRSRQFDPPQNMDAQLFWVDESPQKMLLTYTPDGTLVGTAASHDGTDFPAVQVKCRGRILNATLSPDRRFVVVQQVPSTLILHNIESGESWEQGARKDQSIVGFHWTSNSDFFFVTKEKISHVRINPKRNGFVPGRTYGVPTKFIVFNADTVFPILLVATGMRANVIQGFLFTPAGVVQRIPKFEIDIGERKEPLKPADVVILNVYGTAYCCHIDTVDTSAPHLALYKISSSNSSRIVLKVPNYYGPSSVTTSDNLVLLHCWRSKVVMIFDIVGDSKPIVPAQPLTPYVIDQSVGESTIAPRPRTSGIELYSARDWSIHPVDYVVDRRRGYIWEFKVNLSSVVCGFKRKTFLVQFLLRRKRAKGLLLTILRTIVEDHSGLARLSQVFDILARVYVIGCKENDVATLERLRSPEHLKNRRADDEPVCRTQKGCMVLTQHDMCRRLFWPINERKSVKDEYLSAVVVDYVRSLVGYGIAVIHDVHLFLIDVLVRQKRFYVLHQYLQYHVVSDSEMVAEKLLEFADSYRPAYQLSLDMLKRLHKFDRILEVLLQRGNVLGALRLVQSANLTVSPRQLLEAARETDDPMVFYAVFTYFAFEKRASTRISPSPPVSGLVSPSVSHRPSDTVKPIPGVTHSPLQGSGPVSAPSDGVDEKGSGMTQSEIVDEFEPYFRELFGTRSKASDDPS